ALVHAASLLEHARAISGWRQRRCSENSSALRRPQWPTKSTTNSKSPFVHLCQLQPVEPVRLTGMGCELSHEFASPCYRWEIFLFHLSQPRGFTSKFASGFSNVGPDAERRL